MMRRTRARAQVRLSRAAVASLLLIGSPLLTFPAGAASRTAPSTPGRSPHAETLASKHGIPSRKGLAAHPRSRHPAPEPTARLAAALGPAALPGARISTVLLNASNGLQSIASLNAGMRLPPGRLESVVTLAAALWHLGTSDRVTTTIVSPSPSHGVVLGNLVLRGGGDATLSGQTLASMAAHIAHRVHLVTGNVLADGSLFAYPVTPPGWPMGVVAQGTVPGAAALSVDQARATVTILPAGTPGADATIQVLPAGAFSVSGTIRTVAASGAPSKVSTSAGKSGTPSPKKGSGAAGAVTGVPGPSSATTVAKPVVSLAPNGTGVVVSGTVLASSGPVQIPIVSPFPAREAAAVLRADLVRDHVKVEGGVGTGLPIPRAITLASAVSPPLSGWVPTVLGTSGTKSAGPSPLAAETVDRLLCSPSALDPCGASAASRIVRRFLARVGAPSGSVITDGSGLSVQDEMSSHALARTLGVGLIHAWGAPLLHGMSALPAAWKPLPTRTLGWTFSDPATGEVGILALIPFTTGSGPKGHAGTAVYAALAVDPALGTTTLEGRLAEGAAAALGLGSGSTVITGVASGGTDGASPSSSSSSSSSVTSAPSASGQGQPATMPKAAINTVPSADTGLLRALNAAGPGTSVSATIWPVGASGPTLDWNGAALEPAPGAPSLLLGEAALSQGRVPTTSATRAVVDGTLEGRVLYGSIGLIGSGDPTLTNSALTALAREIAALGVRSVTAGVTADDAALPLTMDADWPWQVAAKVPYVPQDALMSPLLDLFSIAVLPGHRPGSTPEATLVPDGLPARVDNEARTVPGSGSHLHLWPVPGENRFVLTGTIGTEHRLGVVFLRVFPNPALATARFFRQALVAVGIRVGPAVTLSPVPTQAPLLASVPSAPPSALLSAMVAAPGAALTADVAEHLGGLPASLALASLEARAADWGGGPAPHLSSLFGLGPASVISSSDMAHALSLFTRSRAGTANPGPSSVATLADLMPNLATGVRGVVVPSPSLGEVGMYGFLTPKKGPDVAFTILASGLDRPSQALVAAVTAALGRLAHSPGAG